MPLPVGFGKKAIKGSKTLLRIKSPTLQSFGDGVLRRVKGGENKNMKELAFANALAAITAIVYVVCSLLVVVFPGFFKLVSQSWFHGIDIGLIWTGSPRGNFLVGFVTAVVGMWLAGRVFAWLYNQFSKK